MLKLVKGMAIFLMLVGMITTAYAEFDTNRNENIPEVAKVEIAEPIKERNDDVQIHLLVMKQEDVAEATEPTLVETAPVEETLPQETVVTEVSDNNNVEIERKPTEAEKKAAYHTGYLTARKGYITDSPCGPNGDDGYETWYPTHPGGAVKILARECGFTDLKMEVCRD